MAVESPTDEQVKHLIKCIKRGNTAKWDFQTYAMAATDIRQELLDAIEPVLHGMLNLSCGDIDLLNAEEQRLLDVYGSWDRENHGRRKTVAELIEETKDDTWTNNGGNKNVK